mmetsp:Transcript_117807/g.345105  ORF Transcript_117807/g.345105 Transcript_117807/m.345105 type:complete len:230 (-) Transcript_117807:9-698(-)
MCVRVQGNTMHSLSASLQVHLHAGLDQLSPQPNFIRMHLLMPGSCSLAISLGCASPLGQALPGKESYTAQHRRCNCGCTSRNCRRVPSNGVHAVLKHAAGEQWGVHGGGHDKDSQQGCTKCHRHATAWQCRQSALDGSTRLRCHLGLLWLCCFLDPLCLQIGLHVLLACHVVKTRLPHGGIARRRRCCARLAGDGSIDRRHPHCQLDWAVHNTQTAESHRMHLNQNGYR